MNTESKTVNLLWTGGWDSTFRLLTLAANDRVRIHIYYVISPDRQSTEIEMRTMEDILARCYERFPGLEGRIAGITHFNGEDITPDQSLRDKYEELNSLSHFGTQYTYLAEFAQMQGLDDLEMSIAKDDGRVYVHLETHCEPVQDPVIGEYHRLVSDIGEDSPYSLFKYFSFPVITITKVGMMEIAKEKGVFDILNMSWFCHWPDNGKPCGVCNPCRCAIEEGMAFRLPRSAIIHSHMPTLYRAYRVLKEEGVAAFTKRVVAKVTGRSEK